MGKIRLGKNETVDEFLKDIQILADDYGINADITVMLNVREMRIKPLGNLVRKNKVTNVPCPECGTKLKFDGRFYWCQKTSCNYIGENCYGK